MSRKRCVVIGAGLAGLSAAYKLAQRGWGVEVFEAKAQAGGRVHSHTFTTQTGGQLVCELGAEWIGKSHKRVLALCEEFGLDTEPHRYSTTFWKDRKPGTRVYGPEDATLPAPVERAYVRFLEKFKTMSFAERQHLDLYDWWTVLGRNGLDQELLRQRELEDGTDFGESIRMASAYVAAMEYAHSSDSDELDRKVTGGNVRLCEALVQAVRAHGGRVRLSTPVRSIQQTKTSVILRVGPKSRPHAVRPADLCICTVPATRLQHFAWSPEPEEHLEAARQLQYSRITKTAVLFERRFWPASRSIRRRGRSERTGFAMFSNRVADFCFDSTYRMNDGTAGVLCSYSFGEKAANISSEDPQKLANWIRGDVLKVLRALKVKKAGTGFQQTYRVEPKPWHDDEWAGGAYAFYRPGQWFTVRPILQRPFGRVLFAGEHLAEDSGFMESAIQSGETTAGAI